MNRHRHGRSMHHAIRRRRERMVAQGRYLTQAEVLHLARLWSEQHPNQRPALDAFPFGSPGYRYDLSLLAAGTFSVAEWEAAVARAVAEAKQFVANEGIPLDDLERIRELWREKFPGIEALAYFRDGLASLPPVEP